MAPVSEAARAASKVGPGVELDVSAGLFAFEANGVEHESPEMLARALRRAVMARAQSKIGERAQLDRFFSGHEKDGSKAKAATEHSNHLAFQWEPASRRLLVIPPHALDRRPPTFKEREHLETLCGALEGLVELRAGRAGRLHLVPTGVEDDDALVKPSRRWISVSPYTVTRHAKRLSAHEAIERDVVAECLRRGFPKPRVTVLEARGVSGHGLEARIQLEFFVAVQGPVALGRTRHLGGGLFRAE
jgi:CRISPR-associated protein Csb2